MPNYTFECKKCGEYFDVTESIQDHDRHRDKFPKCGSKDVRQKFSTFFAKTSKKSKHVCGVNDSRARRRDIPRVDSLAQ